MVYDFERNKIRQQEIEVRALVALAAHGTKVQKWEALKHLQYFAYPEALAERINNGDYHEKFCPKCGQWDCGPGPHGGLCVYSTESEIKKWENDKK